MVQISVIIPVYNAEKYLRPCLDSVLEQSLQNIEVICVEAGSDDDSLAVLKEYARKDTRLQVFSGLGRLDAGAARNIGLAAAKGEYLSFLDADDLFKPEMLEEAYQKACDEKSDIVVFRAQQMDMRTGMVEDMPWSLQIEKCPLHSPFSPDKMAKYIFNSFENWTWNKLFRRDFIEKNGIVFQSIDRTNDMAFTCQALVMARRISILPKVYVTYRIGTGTSLQQTNHMSPVCFWDAYRETKKRLISIGQYEKYERSFVNAVLQGTIYNLKSVKTDEAYQAILGLLKDETDEFGLNTHKKNYYYSAKLYEEYLRLISGAEECSHAIGIEKLASKMLGPLRSFMNCCEDRGLAYSVGIVFKKIARTVISK